MAFDFRSATRILRRSARLRLQPRGDQALSFVGESDTSTRPSILLLDTSVYIDRMQDRVPPIVEDLLVGSLLIHSSVAVQELLLGVGLLDPSDHRTAAVAKSVETIVRGMPSQRLFTPDIDILASAAVHAGILARTQGYARDDRRRALSDCTLFLHALKLGLTVLTRNLRDFDLLLQLRPEGRVLFYRV